MSYKVEKIVDTTPNIHLEKPSQNDYYDVDVNNRNADIIDGEISGVKVSITEIDGFSKTLDSNIKTHVSKTDNPHGVTKTQVGLGNVSNFPATSSTTDPSNEKVATAGAVKAVNDAQATHAEKKDNPHAVTKAQVGLGNVYNYSVTGAVNDSAEDKYATSGAVKKAYDRGTEAVNATNAHVAKVDNPHKVTKAQVGLGEVQNYPVTSAINDTSNAKYATAGAVKQAYDKAVSVLEESRKNCPYRVGDMLTTTLADSPSVTWVGTSWQKIEGKYLKGSKGTEASKTTGGSNTKTLTVDQMPSHGHSGSGSTGASGKHTHTANHGHTASQSAHTHTANHNHTASQVAHAHTQPAHTHTNSYGLTSVSGSGWSRDANYNNSGRRDATSSAGGENTGSATPAVTVNTTNVTTSSATPTVTVNNTNVTTSEIADHTHTVSVSISATGGGQAIDIQPEHYIVHHWLRTA